MTSLSRVRLFATPRTAAHRASPSMGFSRQEYWHGLPFPSPGDLPHPGIEPSLPHCRQMLYPLNHKGSPICCMVRLKKKKKKKEGNSHIVQCESSALSLPRALVQSLVGELRSCKLCGWPKLEKKKIDRSGSPGMDSGPLYVVCDKKPQHRL